MSNCQNAAGGALQNSKACGATLSQSGLDFFEILTDDVGPRTGAGD